MTEQAALDALIEKLERGTGPDRELDWLIWFETATTSADHQHDNWPAYTASIDAALTLVPEGWEWVIGGGNSITGEKPWASVWPEKQPFPDEELDIWCEGGTHAIALCIAALRARKGAL